MQQHACLICDTEMTLYFEKEEYLAPSTRNFTQQLVPVQFDECPVCHFLSSRTHQSLPAKAWEKLNHDFHHYAETEGRETHDFNQPPYAAQAMMIELLARNHIIDDSAILDYAAGYGSLSHIQRKYFDRRITCYDKYVKNPIQHYIDNPPEKAWSLVINSAMFEHVLTRADLDAVNDLVSDTGALMIHTVVVERVPKDPNWFYIDTPVHTAVHTNQSMELLMAQWGYKSSIYSPISKAWVLLRKPYSEVQAQVEKINAELQTAWLFGKDGFVDYWKTR